MANLKVFVSSTCYDLSVVRSQLRNFLIGFGYEPVMSEYSDILFDPRLHTHTSCVQEVVNCDMVIIIIGSRYGGTAIPIAIDAVNFDELRATSTARNFGEDKTNLSVTQLEVLKAIETGIPLFTFIDNGVMHDHLTYEKNKGKTILKDIEFPSIDKQETAGYIFEFINFLRLRAENNSIVGFSRLEDIEVHLRKQWSALLQRLLYEQKTKKAEERRIDYLSNQIADIKTAIMTSISNAELKEIAKGAIKFRMLIDFIQGITQNTHSLREVINRDVSWERLLTDIGIREFKRIDATQPGASFYRCVGIRDDNSHFKIRSSVNAISRLGNQWEEFRQLSSAAKEAIALAIADYLESRPFPFVHFVDKPFVESAKEATESEEVDE